MGVEGRVQGRHKTGVVPRLAGSADHHVAVAELARPLVLAADALHQTLVDLPQQAPAQGQPFPQPLQAEFQRMDVVRHFRHVRGMGDRLAFAFKQEQLVEPRHGPLDPAGQHGFAANEGSDQQMRVRKTAPDAGQFAQRAVGLGKLPDQSEVELEVRRERGRIERPVPLRGTDEAAGGVWGEVGRLQGSIPSMVMAYYRAFEFERNALKVFRETYNKPRRRLLSTAPPPAAGGH